VTDTPPAPSLAEHRQAFAAWLDATELELTDARRRAAGRLEGEMAYNRRLCARLWDAGFTRPGWPESAGGRPGPAIHRAVVAEELTLRGLVHQNIFIMPEILGAGLAAAGPDGLVGTYLERYLSGEEWWCQGFSEPDAGSDLASLKTRAELLGDTFVLNGQKVWTTLAQFAARCVLLARTGPPGSAHRGITALFVDMDAPGVTVRPLRGMNGDDEFSECFFDDVEVPADRVIGELHGGWKVAMQILAFERATIFWARAAWLHHRLGVLVSDPAFSISATAAVGVAYQRVAALRARSRRTQQAMSAGAFSAPESSIDKAMMAAAEQAVFDAALGGLGGSLPVGDDGRSVAWRNEYFYSRAASIYGGTGEIQRNIIAERLLGLPMA
jgi:alkylation response protein AidB-like acyl-CoA dehydrogenase